MRRCCSKCGAEAPFNPPNWIKLTESHITTYTTRHAILHVGCVESEPYWLLCPKCYKKIFKGLTRYKDKTTTEIIDATPDSFTKSTGDYYNEKPLTIKMDHYVDYQYPTAKWIDHFDTITAECTNKDSLKFNEVTAQTLDEQYQRFGYTRV